MVLCGPYSFGQSCQRQPIFKTCMIPLRMRRSSFRSGPGWFVGRCGMIFAHCSSSNQNKFESIGLGSLQVDQAIESNEPCLGLEPRALRHPPLLKSSVPAGIALETTMFFRSMLALILLLPASRVLADEIPA